MIVTFFGHKDIIATKEMASKLKNILHDLIEEGADSFLLGGYGGFDAIAAHTVYNLKKEFPHIRSTLVIPYLDFKFFTDFYDDTVYPPLETVPKRFAVSRRNKWMIEQSDAVVSYVLHNWGGAATAIKYAKQKKKRIISVADNK